MAFSQVEDGYETAVYSIGRKGLNFDDMRST